MKTPTRRTHMKKTNLLYLLSTSAPAILTAFLISAHADEIDWNKAKELRQKSRAGLSLSAEETAYLARAMKARSGANATRGDGSDEVATVEPFVVSEETSPIKTLTATASDGNEIDFAYRSPTANRPLPAIVFIHGSLGQRRLPELIENLKSNPTQTRFLKAGYVAVAATFRTYVEDPLSNGPTLDLIAIVKEVRELPEVDPESIVVFGTSGGGSIALELAGSKEVSFPAMVIGEPATILFTGLMTDLSMREPAMRDYKTLYTEERRHATEKKIGTISCPLLIHHGDTHPLNKINFDIVFPAIEEAGKTIVIKRYPGENHGFYWGNRTSEATVEAVVSSTLEFIEPLLKSPPADPVASITN